jgi:hypothetical protein
MSVITEDHFFRWLGAKELRHHHRYVQTMVPNPRVYNVRVAHREVDRNPEGVQEQIHIAFTSAMDGQNDVCFSFLILQFFSNSRSKSEEYLKYMTIVF